MNQFCVVILNQHRCPSFPFMTTSAHVDFVPDSFLPSPDFRLPEHTQHIHSILNMNKHSVSTDSIDAKENFSFLELITIASLTVDLDLLGSWFCCLILGLESNWKTGATFSGIYWSIKTARKSLSH